MTGKTPQLRVTYVVTYVNQSSKNTYLFIAPHHLSLAKCIMFSSYLSVEIVQTISQSNQQKHSNPYKPRKNEHTNIVYEHNIRRKRG